MHLNGHFYHTPEYSLFQEVFSEKKKYIFCNNRPGTDLLALLTALSQQNDIKY